MPLLPSIPSPLTELSRTTLEWDRFLELLAGYAQSGVGRAWIAALVPSTDLAWLDREHARVAEMGRLLAEGVRPALGALFDPTDLLAKARLEGAILEPAEIRNVLALADAVSGWAAVLRSPPDRVKGELPELTAQAGAIVAADLGAWVETLRAKMLPDGSLADDASPELGRIRREIDRQERTIADSLRGALRRLADEGSTQEELITIRGERFVIPVKAELKRRVGGVVHGASSSGQTVYVEPLETIELNNELVRLFEEESAEMQRVYLMMTRQIGARADVLEAGAQILAEVETLYVRARFAAEFDCVRPRFAGVRRFVNGAFQSNEPELRLLAARHPLLEARLRRGGGTAQIVPLSLALEAGARQLIISGPNTGGKTVGLKTTGLLGLMAQAGVPVPALEATLPVFSCFLADIGDAQSIEMNLSTFSAHVTNLTRLAEIADASSLVLLDELGSATDPEEGSALAVAIAEHFLHSGAWSLISTHHTSLKVYGETTDGVRNAAVGFNERTLAPTYELRMGVPGASAGINIAERLGLLPTIVGAARGRLSTQTLDVSAFLDRLHAQIRELGEDRLRTQAEERELRRERARLEAEGLEEWRRRTRDLEGELTKLLREFEAQTREVVTKIEDAAVREKLEREAEKRVAQARREFSERFTAEIKARRPSAMRAAAEQAAAHKRDPRTAAVGDLVKLKLGRTGQQVRVTRELDPESVEVAMGAMKMRVRRDDIAQIVENGARTDGKPGPSPVVAARGRRNVNVQLAEPEAHLRPEINVIGYTADHAADEVEKFIDQAFLAGLQRVRVVHGTGAGVLRRTLRAALAEHPHVATVTEADSYEGGQGATVVELRQ